LDMIKYVKKGTRGEPMPRAAREKSKNGIYHIMLRGANRQEIFHDDEDNIRFLETLDRYKQKSKMKLYGWCLMGNHIHLLIGEGQEDISITMKRIGISYAWFYNWKYNTIGHLFQDRYRSEKVEDDDYMLTVVRYIHQNPVKAGIVKNINDWKWSSCHGYYGDSYYPPSLLDEDFILGTLSEDRTKAIERFIEFNEEENVDQCLDEIKTVRLTDREAGDEIRKLIEGYEIAEIKSLPTEQRKELLRRIKEIEGLSLRQAARILGVSHVQIFSA
jgi:putative transposase